MMKKLGAFENPFMDASQLYNIHELHHATMSPVHTIANATKMLYRHPMNMFTYTRLGKTMAAASELVERATRRYIKPEFEIGRVVVNGKSCAIEEETVLDKPFCSLLHFKKNMKVKQPKVLVVAPMSGHFATLLRGTVKDLLPYADVYITDWQDAREVPLYHGKFDLGDYISYVMEFLHTLGGDTHVMAVCQPSVPVLAAVALMTKRDA